MSLKDKEIDDIFNEGLADDQTPFDETAWEQVAPLIQARSSKIAWYTGGTILLCLFLCGIGFYYWNADSATHSNKAMTSSGSLVSSTPGTEHSIETNVKTATLSGINTPNKQEDAEIEQVNMQSEPDITPFKLTQPPVKDIQETSTNTINILEHTPSFYLIENTSEAPNLVTENKASSDETIPNKEETKKSDNLENKSLAVASKPIKNRSDVSFSHSLVYIDTLHYSLASLSYTRIKPLQPKVLTKFNFSIAILCGVGVPQTPTDIAQSGDLTQEHIELNSELLGMAFKSKYKKIGLDIGITKHTYRCSERIQDYQSNLVTDTSYRVLTKSKIINGKNYWELREEIDSSYEKSEKRIEIYNADINYSFVQIPIELNYTVRLLPRFTFSPNAGIRLTIPTSKTISLFDEDSKKVQSLNLSDFAQPITWSTGLDLSYKIRPMISAEIGVKYLVDEQRINSLKGKLTSNRMLFQMGCSFRLK